MPTLPQPQGPPVDTPAPSRPQAQPQPQSRGTVRELRVYLTGYTWQDNTPPNSAIISNPVLHRAADGQGTYDDPITAAVPGTRDKLTWPAGTRFYLPSIERYVIVEDAGASRAPRGAKAHLDVWVDGRDATRAATDACAKAFTGMVRAELNPPPGRTVLPGPIYAQGACRIPQQAAR